MFVRFQPSSVRPFPAADIFGFEQTIDGLFDSFLGGRPVQFGSDFPAIRVSEDKEATVVYAELSGVSKEDIKISLHDGVLTISGERKQAGAAEHAKTLRNEIWTGKFSRSLELAHEVKEDQLTAELSNGVLKVTLPKAEAAVAREIRIQ